MLFCNSGQYPEIAHVEPDPIKQALDKLFAQNQVPTVAPDATSTARMPGAYGPSGPGGSYGNVPAPTLQATMPPTGHPATGAMGALLSAGNSVDNWVQARRQGYTSDHAKQDIHLAATLFALGLLGAPEAAAGAAPARAAVAATAPAADAAGDLAARDFMSALSRGKAPLSPAFRDKATESLFDALPSSQAYRATFLP